MGTLTVDNLNVNNNINNINGVGKVLQVQSAFKSDTDSTTSTSDVANIWIIKLTYKSTANNGSSKLVQFDVGLLWVINI